jgi:peptidyl-prolyl cis-trans isomerase D
MKSKAIVKKIVALILAFCSLHAFSQENIADQFRKTDNDSVFVRKNSMTPYAVNTAYVNFFDHPYDSIAVHGQKGDVLGPFSDGTYNYYIKVIGVDSALKMSAAHILLCVDSVHCDPKKIYSKAAADALAKRILNELRKGKDFVKLVTKYSQDPGSWNKGGEYKDFFEHQMVEEFERGVLTHKVGEYFAIETVYGVHIMKSTAVPVLDRYAVTYIILSVLH